MSSETNVRSAAAASDRPRLFNTLVWSGPTLTAFATVLNVRYAHPAVIIDVLMLTLTASISLIWLRGRLCSWIAALAAGATIGASAIGTLTLAPFLLLAAAAYVASGMVRRDTVRMRLATRLAIGALAATANGTVLWLVVFGDHRSVPIEEYRVLDLRAHTLLADVPLHDIWSTYLEGGPENLDMMDVRELLIDGFRSNRNTGFIAAAAVRGILGFVLGWDDPRCRTPEASFMNNLSDDDRRRSIAPPGDRFFLFTFESEAAVEIINCTVHAFVVMALEHVAGGHDFYWAFYVNPVGGITPFYMGLIKPFRYGIIYPSVIAQIQRNWRERWGG